MPPCATTSSTVRDSFGRGQAFIRNGREVIAKMEVMMEMGMQPWKFGQEPR